MSARLLAPLAMTIATIAAGCRGGGGGSGGACRFEYAGAYRGADRATDCAMVTSSAGDWTLTLRSAQSTTGGGIATTISIDLGPSPSRRRYTDATVAGWQAVGANGDLSCRYVAGASAVPAGTFLLNLTDLDLGAAPSAHGTLHVDERVHVQPLLSCGRGSRETVDVDF